MAPPIIPNTHVTPEMFPSMEAYNEEVTQRNNDTSEVMVKDGMAQLVNLQGLPVQVPVAEAQKLIDEGYLPELEGDVANRDFREKRAKLADPASTFIKRGLSVATFGLGGMVDAAAHGWSPETAKIINEVNKEENPTAHALGTVAGIAGSALVPGMPIAEATKLGSRLLFSNPMLRLAAKQGAKSGVNTLTRMMGGAAGGVAGGAVATGSVQAADGEFDVGDIVQGGLLGAGMGMAGPALSGLFRARAGAAAKTLAKAEKEHASQVTAAWQKVKSTEAAAAKAAKDATAAKPKWTDFTKEPPASSYAAAKESQKLSEMLAQEAVALKEAAIKLEGISPLSVFGKGATAASPNLTNSLLGAVANPSPAAMGGMIGLVKGGPLGAVAGVGVGKLYTKIAPLVKPALGRAASYTGKKIGAAGRYVAGKASKLDDAIMPGDKRYVAIALMSEPEYKGLFDRLEESNLEYFEEHLRETEIPKAIAFGLDPEAVNASVELKMQTMGFLRDKLPQQKTYPKNDMRSLAKGPRAPTAGERYQFGKYARVALQPSNLVDDMERGLMTTEGVEVWESLYPEALAQLREVYKGMIAELSGQGTYSPEQIRQGNILLGQPKDYSYIQMMQQNHQPQQQQQQPQGGPPQMGGVSQALQTPIQQAFGGQ